MDKHQDDTVGLVELGVASIETQGVGGPLRDNDGSPSITGAISDD